MQKPYLEIISTDKVKQPVTHNVLIAYIWGIAIGLFSHLDSKLIYSLFE